MRSGLKKIKKEYEKLKQVRLAKTIGEAPAILHSEEVNPEFIALQEDLGLLDIEMIKIENILKNARIIKAPAKTAQESINLGATVLVDINGKNQELTIVGTLEADPDLGKISDESPVGKILLGKKAGDRIAFDSSGKITYKIKKISYNFS
jgi:transcription elongation factor GreA